jgi:tRNA-modifying protein YgfZ
MITKPGVVGIAALDPGHPDAAAAAHYGDPMREQRVLATEVGLVDRSHHGILAVSGEERLTWLHSLTSQHLTALAPMTATELLVLSPHGHVEEHAGVLDDGATTWLDLEPGRVAGALSFFEKMVFLTRVAPVDRSGDLALLSLVGPATPEALSALGVGPLGEPDAIAVPPPKFAAGSVPSRPSTRYAAAALPGFDGFVRRVAGGADLIVPRAAVDDVVAAAAVPVAGLWAYEALRVAALRPRLGFETDHRTLAAEVGWGAAVHYDKGCYRGQETVARVHHLGRPPRRLVLLHLDGLSVGELPKPRTPVTTAEGRAVGVLGTAVSHHELGPIALALVRHGVDPSAALTVSGVAAAIDPE